MAAVEKYERVLPQAEENGFSYREFSSTEGTRRKPMPGGKSMLLKLDWLMARGMECIDHGTVSTETKDCTWAEPGSALAQFTFAYNDIPKSFQGFPTVLLTAGLMAIAFFGFSGLI